MKKRYLMSVSGGRTSVMLAKLIIDKNQLNPVTYYATREENINYVIYENDEMELILVFANTSLEKEETLIFMNNMLVYWGLYVIWVEAVVDHRPNKGTKHRVVNFNTAKRKGEVFEDVIKKYGIPNNVFKHCTRELKEQAIRSFMTAIGWGHWKDGYKTIIGYRADEPKRNSYEKAEKLNQYYPLKEWGIKKPDVAYFWNRQPFDLGLIDADGNCNNCFKKGDLKIIYQERTKCIGSSFIRRMENEYGNFVPASRNESISKPPYYFYRHNRTLDDVINQYPELKDKSIDELRAMLNDKSLSEDNANYDLYEQEDCAESCEAFGSIDDTD